MDRALSLYAAYIMWRDQALAVSHSVDNPLAWDRLMTIHRRRHEQLLDWRARLDEQGAGWVVRAPYTDWRHFSYRNDQPELARAVQDLNDKLIDLSGRLLRNRDASNSRREAIQKAAQVMATGERYNVAYRDHRLRITIANAPPVLSGISVIYTWMPVTDPNHPG